jgi:hypothetical protein
MLQTVMEQNYFKFGQQTLSLDTKHNRKIFKECILLC